MNSVVGEKYCSGSSAKRFCFGACPEKISAACSLLPVQLASVQLASVQLASVQLALA